MDEPQFICWVESVSQLDCHHHHALCWSLLSTGFGISLEINSVASLKSTRSWLVHTSPFTMENTDGLDTATISTLSADPSCGIKLPGYSFDSSKHSLLLFTWKNKPEIPKYVLDEIVPPSHLQIHSQCSGQRVKVSVLFNPFLLVLRDVLVS